MIVRSFVFIMIIVTALSARSLVWLDDYDKACDLAKKNDKPIYVLITSINCKWCRKFERKTLTDKKVRKMLASKFILLHFVKERHYIPSKFAYTPVPRHYIVESDGIILAEEVGFLESDVFTIVLENALEERKDAIHTDR